MKPASASAQSGTSGSRSPATFGMFGIKGMMGLFAAVKGPAVGAFAVALSILGICRTL